MTTADPAPPLTLHDLPGQFRALEGVSPLLDALATGRSGTIDGAWGSSSALALAALAAAAPATLLIVVAHPAELDRQLADVSSFLGTRPAVFPALESLRPSKEQADPLLSQRLRLVQSLAGPKPPRAVLATVPALLQPVPGRDALAARRHVVRVGEPVDLDKLAVWLVDHGYTRVDAVEFPGDFARRGGILDAYSPDADSPYRIELFGDEVEGIRQFATDTQRSLRDATEAGLLALVGDTGPDRGHLADYLPRGAWVALVEPDELRETGQQFLDRLLDPAGLFTVEGVTAQLLKFPSVTVSAFPAPSLEATCHLRVESVERFSGNVTHLRDELDGIAGQDRVLLAAANDAERQRLGEVLAAGALAQSDRLQIARGHVAAGFRLVDLGLVVLGSQELFHRTAVDAGEGKTAVPLPRRRVESRAIDSFLDLHDGDVVVHVSHGLARFRGMVMLDRTDPAGGGKTGGREEHLVLEFRDGVMVYVPASKIDLVQKYVGGGKSDPELSKFGGTSWGRKKDRVEAAVQDMAAEMLQLQALRNAQAGFPFPPDSDWQHAFEASFPYQETPDQLTSLREVRQDMQRVRPMDRLVCGDVGFGKTEVALRAAFKAADNGKQVAILVPTTVLAEQHFRTFRERFAEYPFTVECLSRFRSAREQKRILQGVKAGSVDVVVGTHRLTSQDVTFKDLGLVVIDEEQRFGVEHKERLKRLRALVHVLTLSATPIPRTLHLALLGIRDISSLETPPVDRLPIETRIVRFDKALVRAAVVRELNRDGQVYFVHNRVHDIHEIAGKVQSIVPEAKIVVAHGQQTPDELEAAMVAFVQRKADILVATTIIESGLDIPNANTIFIHEADKYGLADLHQLRGRVGRSKTRAYAYLLLDTDRAVSPDGARRLKAIEEFTSLGAGFKIAMRDLEIRGAGNILGTQQSGHIAAVGYELYCSLLENAVRHLQHKPSKAAVNVSVDLPFPAYLPHDYVTSQKSRLEVYRRLARVRDPRKLDDFRQELRDRYGPPPENAEWLLRQAELRMLAARWHVHSIHRLDRDVLLGYSGAKQIKALAERSDKRFRIVDDKVAYYRLGASDDQPLGLFKTLRHLLRWQ